MDNLNIKEVIVGDVSVAAPAETTYVTFAAEDAVEEGVNNG